METTMTLEWVLSYEGIAFILAAIMATQTLCTFIVNATPTPRDDLWAGRIYKFIERIAGIWTDMAKQLPGEKEAVSKAVKAMKKATTEKVKPKPANSNKS